MRRLLAAASALACLAWAGQAPAQTSAAPADTSAPVPVTAASAARAAVGNDNDRFELGAAIADGPFDALGTFGYERYVQNSGPLEHWVHVELTGASAPFLTEGTLSVAYFLRPLRTIRRKWAIRPILEAGPGAHLVVQVAKIQGFGETAFHSRGYLKTHAIAGLETLLGRHWGLVVRGRFSAPAHHPFDYAQIALFRR
jgi:hypothetical protein